MSTGCDAAGRRRCLFRPRVLGVKLGQAEGGSFSSGRRHADPFAAAVREGTAGGVPSPAQRLWGCCKGRPVSLGARCAASPNRYLPEPGTRFIGERPVRISRCCMASISSKTSAILCAKISASGTCVC